MTDQSDRERESRETEETLLNRRRDEEAAHRGEVARRLRQEPLEPADEDD